MKKTFKEIREEKGVSVSFVSRMLNCTPQTIRNKEKGYTDFTWIEALKLCKFYGVDIENVKA